LHAGLDISGLAGYPSSETDNSVKNSIKNKELNLENKDNKEI